MTIDLAKLRAETLARMENAKRDDCLDRMVPSDLRVILGHTLRLVDEIERLRDENNKLRDDMSGGSFYQEDDIDAMQNEIERLRGALAPIVNHALFHDREYLSQELNEKLDAARAALSEGDPA